MGERLHAIFVDRHRSASIICLRGTRKIVDVVFSYTNRNADFIEKVFMRVNVTEEFPFLVAKLSPYYDW